ncbi:MAG: hypothetical protein CM15mP18_0090 [Methanobacteriota archaeon]|nr:MAG: hypothetical protein CM15mP18_0090 [Euryarchaeota archaeon]
MDMGIWDDVTALKQGPPSRTVRRAGGARPTKPPLGGASAGARAPMRWIDLLADLGLGLWRVPVLGALTDGAPALRAAFDARPPGLGGRRESRRAHHGMAGDETMAGSPAVPDHAESRRRRRDWPDRSGPRTGTQRRVDANRSRDHAACNPEDIG